MSKKLSLMALCCLAPTGCAVFNKPLAALTLWDLVVALGALFVGYLAVLFATLILVALKEAFFPPKQ